MSSIARCIRTDDLISTLMTARDKDGQPLSDGHVLARCGYC